MHMLGTLTYVSLALTSLISSSWGLRQPRTTNITSLERPSIGLN